MTNNIKYRTGKTEHIKYELDGDPAMGWLEVNELFDEEFTDGKNNWWEMSQNRVESIAYKPFSQEYWDIMDRLEQKYDFNEQGEN